MNDAYPEGWSEEERSKYKAAYLAGEEQVVPFPEHDEGECTFCDALRQMRREADEEERP